MTVKSTSAYSDDFDHTRVETFGRSFVARWRWEDSAVETLVFERCISPKPIALPIDLGSLSALILHSSIEKNCTGIQHKCVINFAASRSPYSGSVLLLMQSITLTQVTFISDPQLWACMKLILSTLIPMLPSMHCHPSTPLFLPSVF